jgi:acyl-CoA thioesterase
VTNLPDFDRETAVTPLGDGRYECGLDRAWWVHRGPNGGYLAAITLRALAARVGERDRAPRSLTIHYTEPPSEGSVVVATAVERAGRSLTSCTARIEQDGRLIGLALGAFSRARPGPQFCDLTIPPVPGPKAIEPVPVTPEAPPIASRWDTRWVMGVPPVRGGAPSDEAVTGCWIRLPEGHVVDAPVATAITDAAIPAVFTRVDQPIVVPTVDLTIHFRSTLPVPGSEPSDFVLALFRTGVVADGFLEEDGEVWAPDGTLIAQSRQFAAVLPMPG